MTSDTGIIGEKSDAYVRYDGDKLKIVVDETHYDAGYDCYFTLPFIINNNPTPQEIFKIRLANPGYD